MVKPRFLSSLPLSQLTFQHASKANSNKFSSQQLRFYSPRQSRRNPNNGYKEQPQQQYTYEEPDVTYSYPNAYQAPSSGGYLQYSDGIADMVSQPCLVMERQMEMMNVFLGFEQQNRYAVLDINGHHLGYMEEDGFGFSKVILRQITRLHRPFSVRVLDRQGQHVMTVSID